jgi:hypothetical protein
MPVAENLSLRINGREHSRVSLRLSVEGGYPGGTPEVVIEDEFLGTFALTRAFTIELKEGGGDWEQVTLLYFITMLNQYFDTWQNDSPSFLEPCSRCDAPSTREALTAFVTKLSESRETVEDTVR